MCLTPKVAYHSTLAGGGERGREPEGEREPECWNRREVGPLARLANLNIPGFALFSYWLAGRTFLARLGQLQECVKVPCSQNLRKVTINRAQFGNFPILLASWHIADT